MTQVTQANITHKGTIPLDITWPNVVTNNKQKESETERVKRHQWIILNTHSKSTATSDIAWIVNSRQASVVCTWKTKSVHVHVIITLTSDQHAHWCSGWGRPRGTKGGGRSTPGSSNSKTNSLYLPKINVYKKNFSWAKLSSIHDTIWCSRNVTNPKKIPCRGFYAPSPLDTHSAILWG